MQYFNVCARPILLKNVFFKDFSHALAHRYAFFKALLARVGDIKKDHVSLLVAQSGLDWSLNHCS